MQVHLTAREAMVADTIPNDCSSLGPARSVWNSPVSSRLPGGRDDVVEMMDRILPAEGRPEVSAFAQKTVSKKRGASQFQSQHAGVGETGREVQ